MTFRQNNIIIDTGNVFNLDIIRRKALLNPNDEVLEGVQNTLSTFLKSDHELKFVKVNETGQDTMYLTLGQNPMLDYDRSKLKLSVKLFLYPETYDQIDENGKKQLIDESIESILKLLDVTHVDNLIFSIQTSQVDQVLPNLKTFWAASEDHVLSETASKVRSLSTSDIDVGQLRELYIWAGKVKPNSTQINLDACCDIPEDLSKFAKENSIKLLTHNDPTVDFIPVDSLKKTFNSQKANNKLPSELASNDCRLLRKWIARYTFVVSGQGVLLSKGYLVSLMTQ